MFYVYLLRSLKSGIHYTGMAEDVGHRLIEHNKGKSKFTKGHCPWELIYTEGPFTRDNARKREKAMKRMSVKEAILKKLQI